MKKLLQGKALWKKAAELGISTTDTNSFEPMPGLPEEVSDAEVQRRIMEFYRSRREETVDHSGNVGGGFCIECCGGDHSGVYRKRMNVNGRDRIECLKIVT